MIIVRIMGGLGNQLFQYCIYREFLVKGRETYVDLEFYERNNCNRKYELDKLGLHAEEYQGLSNWPAAVADTMLTEPSFLYSWLYRETPGVDHNLLTRDELYLDGYFQSDQYCMDVVDTVTKEIDFKIDKKNTYISDMIYKMENTNSVSIHFRMGDYLQQRALFGNICTPQYYQKAMELIFQKVENPVFYVFSDDIEMVGKMLSGNHFIIVDENRGDSSYLDMYLMSKCKHNILANSTFSWWGAQINRNPSKIVIGPSRFTNEEGVENILRKGWLTVAV